MIDGRTLADLLNYFVEMSGHINYYDSELKTFDWKPFFKKSLPFTIAGMINYNLEAAENNFSCYNSLFKKKPTSAGLQLNANFIFYRFIRTINNWYISLQEDPNSAMSVWTENMIKNKLQEPVKLFISYVNAGVISFGIKGPDFNVLLSNDVWGLTPADVNKVDTTYINGIWDPVKRLNNLFISLHTIFPAFTNSIKLISAEAEKNLENSFSPLKDELQKKHPAHLGLIFTFLNVYKELQNDLNQFTRKHLDYFYKTILLFKSGEATPDRAHLVFEVQKQLKRYLLKKGIKIKDGKDDKKQEILFELDDEILITKTTIADRRNLFVNNRSYKAQSYIEGVYMAPVAQMADGVSLDFLSDPKNVPTLGGKISKWLDPETQLAKPYPNARLGFVLASPVLFLQAGSTRSIEISIDCTLDTNICRKLLDIANPLASGCCGRSTSNSGDKESFPNQFAPEQLYEAVNDALTRTYYYLNLDILKAIIKKGISNELAEKLRNIFLRDPNPHYNPAYKKDYCNCDERIDIYEKILEGAAYTGPFSSELTILEDFIKPLRPLTILFSGEKDWIEPSEISLLALEPAGPVAPGSFTLHIKALLKPEKDAVTFYDKDNLKEDLGNTNPCVKIELNDKIKLVGIDFEKIYEKPDTNDNCCVQTENCCLVTERKPGPLSLYHFFRDVMVDDLAINKEILKVEVCGLKNFVVQNDEAVMDVNGPVYPFGARPDIVDFNVVDGFVKYYITPKLISEAQTAGINPISTAILNGLIKPVANYSIGSTIADIDLFLSSKITVVPDRAIIKNLLLTKTYINKNFIGPDFFIGSREIFGKHWKEIFISLDWKGKPGNFRDYYDGYMSILDDAPPHDRIFGLDDQKFEINLSILENGQWIAELPHPAIPILPYDEETTVPNVYTGTNNRRLFPMKSTPSFCNSGSGFEQTIHIKNDFFNIQDKFSIDSSSLRKYEVTTRNGFLRISLQNQDFLHSDYAYVLARQMNAAAMLAILDKDNNPIKVEGAIYYDKVNKGLVVFNSNEIKKLVADSLPIATRIQQDVNGGGQLQDLANTGNNNPIPGADANAVRNIIAAGGLNLTGDVNTLETNITNINNQINSDNNFQAIIPKEPWTPIISKISLDYIASATSADVDLIHLYPFSGTYKSESLKLKPSLFPTFCDEGSLFLGLKDLVPGDNLNILFQLAEATADSEENKENIFWYYLDGNRWKPLRTGFEVTDDATKNLTSSGVIKFSLPANITKYNTVMPKELYWIKAVIAKNSRAVSETMAVFTQAILAVFTNDLANDKSRLALSLPSGSLSKLNIADASVKTVAQPYESFDGAVPEAETRFYIRVSETLRHKGRAIEAFDYERIALQAFPKLFKVKCINHSFSLNANEYDNDFPYAPGYVSLAVIPDLNKLKAGNSFQPTVPVSLLEEIDRYIRKRTSPFVRFKSVNPRYEKINFCITVQLLPGKDKNYYREKIKQDIREFLAPWAIGKYDKLSFGQCVFRSDIIQLLESSDYVDFITDLRMYKDLTDPSESHSKLCPVSPRSVLIAGDIEACIHDPECEAWTDSYSSCDELTIKGCENIPVEVMPHCGKPAYLK